MTGLVVFTTQPFGNIINFTGIGQTNLSYGKMGNRKVQLVLQHCFAKMLHVLPPKNKTCFATNPVVASCVNTVRLLIG